VLWALKATKVIIFYSSVIFSNLLATGYVYVGTIRRLPILDEDIFPLKVSEEMGTGSSKQPLVEHTRSIPSEVPECPVSRHASVVKLKNLADEGVVYRDKLHNKTIEVRRHILSWITWRCTLIWCVFLFLFCFL